MALGTIQQEQPKKWLTIHHGKVELSENGQKTLYSFVEGRLLSIYSKLRTYGGETVSKWFIDLKDDEEDLYSISFPYQSGTFKSIVLALASEEQLSASTMVRIEPYQKNNYTNVVVWADGVKLDWVTKSLPPVEEVIVNGKVYKDEAKRMEFIASLATQISQRAQRTA